MKTFKNLYPRICAFENLELAFRKARRGKRRRANVAAFEGNLDLELLRCRTICFPAPTGPAGTATSPSTKASRGGSAPRRSAIVWRTTPCATSSSRSGRRASSTIPMHVVSARARMRRSTAAPISPAAIHTCCRPTSCSSSRRWIWLSCAACWLTISPTRRPWRWSTASWTAGPAFTRRTIKCSGSLATICWPQPGRAACPSATRRASSGPTSTCNELDQFVKQTLRCPAYLRYCDDLLLFADDKPTLHCWRREIERFLESLRLRIHPDKTSIHPVAAGIPFLGFQVFPDHRRLQGQMACVSSAACDLCCNAMSEGKSIWNG